MLAEIPMSALVAVSTSTIAAAGVSVFVWRRPDPVWFKIAVTAIALIPLIGPLFALWVTCFPDRMHPALQAKYPKMVNSYASPHVGPLPRQKPQRRSVWRRGAHRDASGRKRGDAL